LQPLAGAEIRDVSVGGLVFREVVSVTTIQGGVANNVVPDRVTCGVNFRYAPDRTPEAAEARLRELAGADGRLTIVSNAPPASVAIANPLLERLRATVQTLQAAGIRAHLDDRSETLNYRIRDAEMLKVPYMAVVGKREAEQHSVALRTRGAGRKQDIMPVDDLVTRLSTEARARALSPVPAELVATP